MGRGSKPVGGGDTGSEGSWAIGETPKEAAERLFLIGKASNVEEYSIYDEYDDHHPAASGDHGSSVRSGSPSEGDKESVSSKGDRESVSSMVQSEIEMAVAEVEADLDLAGSEKKLIGRMRRASISFM